MKKFPHYSQLDGMDCGPACLRMVAKYYEKNYSIQTLRERAFITRSGVSMLGISEAAESVGFTTRGVRITFRQLATEVQLPCILHWNQNHFVVCYKIRKSKHKTTISIADPAGGLMNYTEEELLRCWISNKVQGEDTGTALLLVPDAIFYDFEDQKRQGKHNLASFIRYVLPYKKELFQVALSMVVISVLQLITPFLTQALADVGIRDQNLNFITLILIAQLIIAVANMSVSFIRNWVVLHMNARINISFISDFLAKLMRLPLHFFDTKMVGDLIQRIGDHDRVKSFITDSSLATLFSFVNFVIFGAVLGYYDLTILGIFVLGNTLYVLWILAFMRYRRMLDIKRFAQASAEQSNIYQLVTSM